LGGEIVSVLSRPSSALGSNFPKPWADETSQKRPTFVLIRFQP
jgi:hypothetical protein